MKILAQETGRAENTPALAVILRIIGGFNGIGWTIYTALSFMDIRQAGIEPVFATAEIGISVTLAWFIVARIISDLHAIRWNTDGYVVKHEASDYKQLASAIADLSSKIDAMEGNNQGHTINELDE